MRSIPVKNTRPEPVKKMWDALACVPLLCRFMGVHKAQRNILRVKDVGWGGAVILSR